MDISKTIYGEKSYHFTNNRPKNSKSFALLLSYMKGDKKDKNKKNFQTLCKFLGAAVSAT